MTTDRKPRRLAFLAVVIALMATQPLAAATFVMVPDGELADRADLVAHGRVVMVEPARQDYHTRYRVALERVFSGSVEREEITVTVLGGEGPGGVTLQVPAAPVFAPGERLLLFLDRRADGSYQVGHLALGAFYQAYGDGRLLWVRSLEEAREAVVRSAGQVELLETAERPRDAVLFEQWLDDRSRGLKRSEDYRLDLEEGEVVRRVTPRWTHLEDRRLRWFDFDTDGSVVWRSYGQITDHGGFLRDGGMTELQEAIAAWNDDDGSEVSFRYGGVTEPPGDLCDAPDGEGRVLFEDPNGYFRQGAFSPANCSGLLAVGGVCYWDQPEPFKGRDFNPVVRGFIVTNQGIGCLFQGANGSAMAAQLFGHELGHALGLGHSCGDADSPQCSTSPFLDQALMRAVLHGDDRGASLSCDDRTGLRYLYGNLPIEGDPPASPTGLKAVTTSSSRIDLSWSRRSTDEDGFAVEMSTGQGFQEVGTLPAGVTSAPVTNLQPGTTYSFRVRAFKCSSDSSFTEPVTATTPEGGSAPIGQCAPGPSRMCLNHNRFSVELTWRDFSGQTGVGRSVPLTQDTGYFWFFHPDNVELTVKVLDGRALNGKFWVFYGALSNVEFTLKVTDTATGAVRTYHNPLHTFASRGDTSAFVD